MRQINRNGAIILLFLITSVFSLTLEPQIKGTADTVTGMLINCQFATALAYTDSLMTAYPDEPLYPYLHLCALGLRDLDVDYIIDSTAFIACYWKTVKTIQVYEKVHGQTSYCMTLLGFTFASHSSFYLMQKKYFSAVGTGLDAMKMLKEAKKKDSTNYDVDLFLGLYNYAKGELKKRLWMVLFWYPGSKKEGIKSIEACKEKSLLASEGARMVLLDIYARESEYDKYGALAEPLLKKYPESRFLLWGRARYFEEMKRYSEASECYEKLAVSYANVKYGDYNLLVTRHKQIEMLDKTGQKKKAAALAKQVLDKKLCSASQRNKKICKDIKRYIND